MNKDRITEAVEAAVESAISDRRHLHKNPELSEKEFSTQEFICSRLDELGIEYKKMESACGVIATIYGQNKDAAIGIRADIDALPVVENTGLEYKSKVPGVMHACGHDVHTAILLGSARVLQEMKSELPASVKLLFQPSEETIGGADQMIKEGCMQNPEVKRVIGLHVDPMVETGKILLTEGAMNAAAVEFHVTVKGKSCHGAHPDKGIDPLIPACAMVTGLQSIITRHMDPADPCLITVGSFHSGSKGNVIPEETVFNGIIRALSKENISKLTESVEAMCKSIATAHSADCKVRFTDSYPVLVNDDRIQKVIEESAAAVIGGENILTATKPSLGADDFAFFCEQCPCFYYSLGVSAAPENAYPLHSDKFCPDEESIKYGILTEVSAAVKLMEEIL